MRGRPRKNVLLSAGNNTTAQCDAVNDPIMTMDESDDFANSSSFMRGGKANVLSGSSALVEEFEDDDVVAPTQEADEADDIDDEADPFGIEFQEEESLLPSVTKAEAPVTPRLQRREERTSHVVNQRASRTQETRLHNPIRNASQGARQWTRPSNLGVNMIRDPEYVYRWINAEDSRNLSARLMEGWEKVSTSEMPKDCYPMTDEQGKFHGYVYVKGLLLCRMPRYMSEQRNRFYQQESAQAMDQVKQIADEMNSLGRRYGMTLNNTSSSHVEVGRPKQVLPQREVYVPNNENE